MEEVVRAGNRRILVKSEKPRREMSVRQRENFIRCLAESCNVTRSAKQAGVVWSTVYRLRQRDAGFAAAWQEAIETGYDRLELGLVQAALAVVEKRSDEKGADAPAEEKPPIEPITFDQAILLLNRHRTSVRAGKARTLRPRTRALPTSEETDAAILKRLAILRRQRGLAERG